MVAELLRILLLEDNPADVDLIKFELEEAGFGFTSKVVMSEGDYLRELQEYYPDIILSDYDLPKYSGALALAEANRRCPDTPFILVTGAVSEDRAIEILTQGAKDYVLKSRLQQRLAPAVRRALAEAAEHKARKQAEEELREAHKTLEERVKIRTADLEFEMAVRKKTEEALLESEERLRKLYHESPIPTLTWQKKGDDFILVDFNRAAIQLTEDKVHKFFGVSATELYKDRPEILSVMSLCYNGKITVRQEIISRHFAPDRFLSVSYGFIPPDLIIVHMDDQTERKCAEETLRETLEKTTWLARFPEENPNPVLRASAEGIVLYCNPASRKDPAWACCAGGPLPDPVRILLTQTMASHEEAHWEVQLGALVYAVTFVPFPEEAYINIYGREITKRKHAEELLRKSEERLNRAQAIACLGNWELDLTNNRLTWSDETYRIFGLEPQEFAATYEAFLERVHPADREAVNCAYSGSLRENRDTYEIEHRVIREHTGEIRFVHERCQHFRDKSGEIILSVGMVQDVTERKRIEASLAERSAKLEALNKELESFTYSVSHDLRAPLRAIDGYAKMILKQQGDKFDENAKNQFDVIRNSAKVMGQLIDDLLALSRLGKEALSLSRLNVEELTKNVWEDLKASNPDRSIDLMIGHLPQGMGDWSLIKQVFVNILSNAMKFTRVREVPRIEVGGYEEGPEVVYYIRDNGVGFDMQYHDNLFGVFKRLHSAAEYEGTGVGLAIVQRIINKHGGRVWAEGKVDEGATFYFTLPAPQG